MFKMEKLLSAENKDKVEKSISPNYLNNESLKSEEDFDKIIELCSCLDINFDTPDIKKEDLLNSMKEYSQERFKKVKEKLELEGLSFDELSLDELLDRLYGIDKIVSFNDKTFFVDITSGKQTVIRNKIKKAEYLEDLYKTMGCDHFVVFKLKINEKIDDDIAMTFAETLELADDFLIDLRIPKTKHNKNSKKKRAN